MSVTQKLVTTNFNVESAASFVSSFANNDFPKYLWSSGTYYDKYDHTDGNLDTKKFYTVVDAGTEFNVFKCLFNASNSTVQVSSTDAPSVKSLEPYPTGDEYIWKYMYSITKAEYEKFATTNYIPVVANTTVEAAAIPGTIEVVDIITRGKGYDNYINNGIFRTTDISVGGNDEIYGAPDTAEAEDDYYAGCVIKITESSAGAANQYRRIVDYRGQGGQKIFILDSPFNPAPAAGDEYEVYPYVYIWGDGSETTAAEGRAIIDSASSNSIVEIEMLAVGAGYRYGEAYAGKTTNSIPVTVDSVFIDLPASVSGSAGFTAATLQPIISPINGHGSDPTTELGGKRVCISTKFTNSEGSTIPVENDFRQVGIIKNPLYTNVDIILKTANTLGTGFSIGETVHQFKQFKLHGNVSVTSGSTTIKKTNQGRISSVVSIINGGESYSSDVAVTVTNPLSGGDGLAVSVTLTSNVITGVTVSNQGNNYIELPTLQVTATSGTNGQLAVAFANPQTPTFKDNFVAGDYVLVTSGTNLFLSKVAGVPQDYQITTTTNSTFTGDNCEVSALVLQASGKVSSVSAGRITLSNVAGVFTENSRVIGLTSNTTSVIQTTAGASPSLPIEVNDKAAGGFNTAVQLTRLTGTFPTGGTSFLEDEVIEQTSLIPYAKPRGAFHHIELTDGSDNDHMYISNKFGIYNLDPGGVRPIRGVTSLASLNNLTNKYPGDFVVGSGQVLYLENLDPITRSGNKSEIIKIILEF